MRLSPGGGDGGVGGGSHGDEYGKRIFQSCHENGLVRLGRFRRGVRAGYFALPVLAAH